MSATPAPQRSPEGRRIFVVGATGQVGGLLIDDLVGEGHSVAGLHRSPESADRLHAAGAEPVQGDIASDDVESFVRRLDGYNAVIVAAGAAGGSQVDAVDGDGPGKLAEAAARAGVSRFLLVSVFMDAWRGSESPGENFERYMAAKRRADVALAATDLDWLIVRPGTLVDDDGTGLVTAGISVGYDSVPRADIAAFLAASTFAEHLNRTAVEVVRGETPVTTAIAALAPRQAQGASSRADRGRVRRS